MNKFNNNSENATSAYNLNAHKTNLVAELESLATSAYIKGDYIKAHQVWKSIRMLINNRFTAKEEKTCKKLELLQARKGYSINKHGKRARNNFYVPLLERYIEFIQDLKRKYGLDILDKPDDEGL